MFITSGNSRVGAARERISLLVGRYSTAAITVVSAVAVATHTHVPFGHAASLAFVLLTPAFAICGLLPDMDGAVVAIVGAAGSIAVNALVVQTMLSIGAWSPAAGVVAVGLITSVLWLLPSAMNNRTALNEE